MSSAQSAIDKLKKKTQQSKSDDNDQSTVINSIIIILLWFFIGSSFASLCQYYGHHKMGGTDILTVPYTSKKSPRHKSSNTYQNPLYTKPRRNSVGKMKGGARGEDFLQEIFDINSKQTWPYNTTEDIMEPFVDSLAATYSSSRTFLWTFLAGWGDVSSDITSIFNDIPLLGHFLSLLVSFILNIGILPAGLLVIILGAIFIPLGLFPFTLITNETLWDPFDIKFWIVAGSFFVPGFFGSWIVSITLLIHALMFVIFAPFIYRNTFGKLFLEICSKYTPIIVCILALVIFLEVEKSGLGDNATTGQQILTGISLGICICSLLYIIMPQNK